MKMQQQDVFFGPVFCASLYSYLHNTPSGPAVSKETDAIKKFSIALIAVLGDRASKFNISHIVSGQGKLEVLSHVHKVKQLLSDQMDFEIKQNFKIFYSQTGMPRGFYIEGLSTEDEKILNNLFTEQHLIISFAEMKALGYNESDPYAALNQFTSLEDRIVLTGKNGDVCVIAESEKLEQLKNNTPQPIAISHAQAIAIIYKSEPKEEKYEIAPLKSLQSIKPDSAQLAEAFKKLSIKCYVETQTSENFKVTALPEEHAKIHKKYDECLHPLDNHLCQVICMEAETDEKSITPEVLATWLGNDNFALLQGPSIITNPSGIQKIRELRREWLEIDSDYLKLLKYYIPHNEAAEMSAQGVVVQLKEMNIIPLQLPVEVRESNNGDFKISVALKYKNIILKKFVGLFSEHALPVTPEIMKILYQQTGIKEIKPAFAKLQEDGRIGKGFITNKNNRSSLIFADEDDVEKFQSYWLRYVVTINSLCKTVVRLQAKSQGCKSDDFKSCCHYLKIIAEHPSPYFIFFCANPPYIIRIDSENLEKLNNLLASYVSITPPVHNFITKLLPDKREFDSWQMVKECKYYVVSKKILETVFREAMTKVPDICKSTLTGKIIEEAPCIPVDNEIWDSADMKEGQKSFTYIKLPQLETFISQWKAEHDYVPLGYQNLPLISENHNPEKHFARRSSSASDDDKIAENSQTLIPFRKITRDTSEYSIESKNSNDEVTLTLDSDLRTVTSPEPSHSSSNDSNLVPTLTPGRQESPRSSLGLDSNFRLIGGLNSGSSPSVSSSVSTSQQTIVL